MPRVRGIQGPYRLFFMSFDCAESPHVHVERERKVCKYWLVPLSLARNHGFNARELCIIRRLVTDYRTEILEAWREHCG
jgi:hypothetical protein